MGDTAIVEDAGLMMNPVLWLTESLEGGYRHLLTFFRNEVFNFALVFLIDLVKTLRHNGG